MNNKNLINEAYSMLKQYLWKKTTEITAEEQHKAYDTLKSVLALLESAKPIDKQSYNTINMDYIPRLYQVEYELCVPCYYNACHELRCFFEHESVLERQVFFNVIDTLKKHIIGGQCDVVEKQTRQT